MHTRSTLGILAGLIIGCSAHSDEHSSHATTSGTGGASSSSTSSSSSSTGGGAAPPTFQGYTRVDDSASAMAGGADVAIAPDGTIYVSWVDAASDVFVARSTDGGETFGAAVQVDDAATVPLVSMARHPYVAADNARVAVTLNDEGGTVHLFVSPAGDALAFDGGTTIGGDVATMFRDFPKAIFLPDGSLAVAWHGYPTTGARIFVSRESDGFASSPATSGAPGVPCECCPIDLLVDAGNLWLGFRNNDGNVREMWLAEAPSAGAFSNWLGASTSEGVVASCPMQGPRLAKASDLLMVWSTRGSASPGAAYISSGNATTWSGGERVGDLMGDEPTIAVGGGGRIYVTAVTGSDQSAMTWSDDGGATWNPPEPLDSPDGILSTPQAENGAGIAALAGVSSSSNVWLLRME